MRIASNIAGFKSMPWQIVRFFQQSVTSMVSGLIADGTKRLLEEPKHLQRYKDIVSTKISCNVAARTMYNIFHEQALTTVHYHRKVQGSFSVRRIVEPQEIPSNCFGNLIWTVTRSEDFERLVYYMYELVAVVAKSLSGFIPY
jgi:hypothetical protein